jgi:hypothetical protein
MANIQEILIAGDGWTRRTGNRLRRLHNVMTVGSLFT